MQRRGLGEARNKARGRPPAGPAARPGRAPATSALRARARRTKRGANRDALAYRLRQYGKDGITDNNKCQRLSGTNENHWGLKYKKLYVKIYIDIGTVAFGRAAVPRKGFDRLFNRRAFIYPCFSTRKRMPTQQGRRSRTPSTISALDITPSHFKI